MNENSVEGKPCINREVKSLNITLSYTDVMIKTNLLAVVTPPSIYHCCSTRKVFWEEKFTEEEKLFSAANMNICSRRNVRKHREIKGSGKYVTLYISLKFDSLEKIKTHLQSQKIIRED